MAKAIGYMKPDIDHNLRLYVPFNEGLGNVAKDYSQYGNHGTFGAGAAAPTWAAEGLDFDGNDHVNVPDSNSLDVTKALTTIARVYATANTNFIAAKRVQGSDAAWGLAIDANSKVEFAVWINNVLKGGSFTQAPVSLNTRTDLVGVYNGSDMKVYVNGSHKQTITPVTGDIDNTVDPVRIGWGYNDTYAFNGIINEVIIYSRAPTSAQIAADCYEVVCS